MQVDVVKGLARCWNFETARAMVMWTKCVDASPPD